ncbi:hypothetical protein EVAR_20761_1 [Eumeta japonica]|uniref:Uncharacterized protein n=1 Tax=Eumeta variegata TaxID=151549 RepID=A0A4C1V927_EUMVA|nr:hypothetical protein EVAR_20761_1 [Eumeta japonica]
MLCPNKAHSVRTPDRPPARPSAELAVHVDTRNEQRKRLTQKYLRGRSAREPVDGPSNIYAYDRHVADSILTWANRLISDSLKLNWTPPAPCPGEHNDPSVPQLAIGSLIAAVRDLHLI